MKNTNCASALQVQGRAGRRFVQVSARHPKSKSQHGSKRLVKKRDIRTSFLRTPVAPELPAPASLQPPAVATLAVGSTAAKLQVTPPASISLVRQPCSSNTSRSSGQPVVAAVVVVAEPPATPQAETAAAHDTAAAALSESLPLMTLSNGTHATSTVSAGSSRLDGAESSAWVGGDRLSTLAALDRALDGLILAPTVPGNSDSSSSCSSSKAASKASGKKHHKKAGSSSGGAAAPAAPTLTTIYCETDWEREVAAAAAQQQLLVVKVEAAQSRIHSSGAVDPTLRFQTHNLLPTALNAYLPHTDLHSGFSLIGSYNGASSASFTSAFDFVPAGGHNAIAHFGGSSSSSSFGGSSSSGSSMSGQVCRLDSPVHHWYQGLAAQYHSRSSSNGDKAVKSPLRFLSLQSDGPRAKALCRRLGVFDAALSAMVFDPSSGRKVLEVCGTKVEQELPAGLLYFGDVDAQGNTPSELLPRITSKLLLEAHRLKADVTVVAFQMRAAPPCIKTYKHLYEAAQANAGCVPFAVMDVDCNEECAALSTELQLERLPTYVVYKHGAEVARLARTSERKAVAGTLRQVLADATATAGPAVVA